jgi:Zn-dependent peptidase ImmA (M78 family)
MANCSAISKLDDAVGSLLRESGLSSRSAPVDLLRVAQHLDVEVLQEACTGPDGRLGIHERRAVIQVSARGSKRRRRFTIAHELGHAYLLHPARKLSGVTCGRWSDVELFCNDFAASLLLPRQWLTNAVARREASLTTLRHIARIADVSLPAASLRLLRSGLWPHALVEWRLGRAGWWLWKANGIDHSLRGRLALTPGSGRQLDAMARARIRQRMRFELKVDDARVETLDADIEMYDDSARMLLPVHYDGGRWQPRWDQPPVPG